MVADPSRGPLDAPLDLRLHGLAPASDVEIRARMVDARGQRWASAATFRADRRGEVDLSASAPVAGEYDTAEAMGLIWSMSKQGRADKSLRDYRMESPQTVDFTATVEGAEVATIAVDRLRIPDTVQRVQVRSHGLVGTLFWPREGGPYPGLLLLGGSEGGLHETDAALLAARGYAVLALAYFGMRGVPPSLVSIPIEYFEAALSFLGGLRRVRGDRLGVLGGSRGGEAALLIAATCPAVVAAVSVVGSGVITQGINRLKNLADILRARVPSWTYRGRPLPFLPNTLTPALETQIAAKMPVELGLSYLPGLADARAVAEATIPVERVNGAVLLVSAGDDRMWPCAELSEVTRRRIAGTRTVCTHLHYADAGHPIAAPPFGPATELVSPGPGVKFRTGGTARANAAARADSWRAIGEFLDDHLA